MKDRGDYLCKNVSNGVKKISFYIIAVKRHENKVFFLLPLHT